MDLRGKGIYGNNKGIGVSGIGYRNGLFGNIPALTFYPDATREKNMDDGDSTGLATNFSGDGYGGLWFDGATGYASLPSGANLGGTGPFEIEIDFNTADILVTQKILSMRSPSSTAGQYYIAVVATGGINFVVYNGGYQFNITTPANSILVNTRHQIRCTREADGSGHIYVDGVEKVSSSPTTNLSLTNAFITEISRDPRDHNNYLTGVIYSTKITDNGTTIFNGNFSENSGQTLNDLSGNGNDGQILGNCQWRENSAHQDTTASQPTFGRYDSQIVSKVRGKDAGVFDGSASKITVPVSPAISPNEITVSILLKLNSLPNSNDSPLRTQYDEYGFLLGTDGTINFGAHDGSSVKFSGGSTALGVGRWHRVGGTAQNGQAVKIYRDEVMSSAGSVMSGNIKPLTIGVLNIGYEGASTRFLHGIEKHVQIFDKAFSDEEWAAFHSHGTLPNGANLIGEWLLEGNTLDTSGNGNHGTATGVTYEKQAILPAWWEFDGGDYLTVADGNGIQPQENYTLVFVVERKPSYLTSGEEIINSRSGENHFLVRIDNATGYVNVYDWVGGGGTKREAPVNVCDGKPHVIVVRRQGSNFIIRIDGSEEYSTDTFSGTIVYTNDEFTIGRGGSGSTYFFTGKLKMLPIVETALTDAQIREVERMVSRETGIILSA